MWNSELGLCPFVSVTEDIQVMIEVASKPAEEIEEEDTEGVDLYRGTISLAYGTLILLRGTKTHLKCNRSCGLLKLDQGSTTVLVRGITTISFKFSGSAMS